MARWPKDNQTALIKFYGDPASEVGGRLVKITPPFKMYYDGKLLKTVTFHKKAAPALQSALQKIWDYYDHDQKLIDKYDISKFAGTYNPRKVRGSKTKWSNHAYGAAIDLDAEDNGFGTGKGDLPLAVIAAFKSEGFSWGGDYKGRTDPMHFEACDRGEPERSFEEWLEELGVKGKPKLSVAVPLMDFAEPEPASVVKPPTAPPLTELQETTVQGDADVWNAQRRLKAMGYSPGGLDGIWGGMTAGAITAFINDRGLGIDPPTSAEMFLAGLQPFRVELAKAEGERFTRPIAPERAEATAQQLAPKLPEVQASIVAERVTWWSGIIGVFGGITKFMSDAIEWLRPVKEFIGDMPWYVWGLGILTVATALLYSSRKSRQSIDASTQAYNEGSRV